MKHTNKQRYLSGINELVDRMFEDLYSRSIHQCERLFTRYFEQSPDKAAFLAEADRYANDQFTNPIPIYNEEMLQEIVRIIELKYKVDPSLIANPPSPDKEDHCNDNIDKLGTPEIDALDGKKYLTAQEVAKFLGVSVHTIYRYNHERKIPFFKKDNGKPKYKMSEIIKWIESDKIKTKSELRRDQGLK